MGKFFEDSVHGLGGLKVLILLKSSCNLSLMVISLSLYRKLACILTLRYACHTLTIEFPKTFRS